MDSMKDFISRVENYCASKPMSVATLGNYLNGNARLWGRFKRRSAILEADRARIEQFMSDNPPHDGGK